MLFLIVTVIADVIGVMLLGKAKGISEPLFLAGGLIAMLAGFVAFSYATKTMSIGFANAAWSGLSLILVLVVSRIFFGEQITVMQYGCMTLILLGVVGLQLLEKA